METKAEYAIQPYQPLTPATWQMIEAIAPAMHAARFFGVSNPEQAMAIMLKGYELGLGLTASFEFIYAITAGGKTKVALSPRGALALIQQSPLCARLEIVDAPGACTVTMERTNGFSYTLTWTMADAQQAGLVKQGGGWEKYPANMLRWRAVGFCADVVFPDVIGGMKKTDELGADLTQDGDTIIDTTWDVAPSQMAPIPQEKKTEPQSEFTTIEALMELWTPEQIMEANDGKVPATSKECLAVAEVLSNG